MNCIETIKVQNGNFFALDYHLCRVEQTMRTLYASSRKLDLASIKAPDDDRLYKFRLIYNESGVVRYEFLPYISRTIRSLKLITSDISYKYKFEDRSKLSELFAMRGKCDDILIIQNGFLTDTSYSNIILEDSNGLYTPAHPLLRGTKRAQLLESRQVQEIDIRVNELDRYDRIYLINAMLDMDDRAILTPSDLYID